MKKGSAFAFAVCGAKLLWAAIVVALCKLVSLHKVCQIDYEDEEDYF